MREESEGDVARRMPSRPRPERRGDLTAGSDDDEADHENLGI